jgi:hypothetical protein
MIFCTFVYIKIRNFRTKAPYDLIQGEVQLSGYAE